MKFQGNEMMVVNSCLQAQDTSVSFEGIVKSTGTPDHRLMNIIFYIICLKYSVTIKICIIYCI